jgi:hypothetical protein
VLLENLELVKALRPSMESALGELMAQIKDEHSDVSRRVRDWMERAREKRAIAARIAERQEADRAAVFAAALARARAQIEEELKDPQSDASKRHAAFLAQFQEGRAKRRELAIAAMRARRATGNTMKGASDLRIRNPIVSYTIGPDPNDDPRPYLGDIEKTGTTFTVANANPTLAPNEQVLQKPPECKPSEVSTTVVAAPKTPTKPPECERSEVSTVIAAPNTPTLDNHNQTIELNTVQGEGLDKWQKKNAEDGKRTYKAKQDERQNGEDGQDRRLASARWSWERHMLGKFAVDVIDNACKDSEKIASIWKMCGKSEQSELRNRLETRAKSFLLAFTNNQD